MRKRLIGDTRSLPFRSKPSLPLPASSSSSYPRLQLSRLYCVNSAPNENSTTRPACPCNSSDESSVISSCARATNPAESPHRAHRLAWLRLRLRVLHRATGCRASTCPNNAWPSSQLVYAALPFSLRGVVGTPLRPPACLPGAHMASWFTGTVLHFPQAVR